MHFSSGIHKGLGDIMCCISRALVKVIGAAFSALSHQPFSQLFKTFTLAEACFAYKDNNIIK